MAQNKTRDDKPCGVRDLRGTGYYRINNEFIQDAAEWGLEAVAVYNILAMRADNQKQSAWPSINSMASMLGISPNSVRKGINSLIDHGWVKKVRRYKEIPKKDGATVRMYTSNLYILLDKVRQDKKSGCAEDSGEEQYIHESADSGSSGEQGVLHDMNQGGYQRDQELDSVELNSPEPNPTMGNPRSVVSPDEGMTLDSEPTDESTQETAHPVTLPDASTASGARSRVERKAIAEGESETHSQEQSAGEKAQDMEEGRDNELNPLLTGSSNQRTTTQTARRGKRKRPDSESSFDNSAPHEPPSIEDYPEHAQATQQLRKLVVDTLLYPVEIVNPSPSLECSQTLGLPSETSARLEAIYALVNEFIGKHSMECAEETVKMRCRKKIERASKERGKRTIRYFEYFLYDFVRKLSGQESDSESAESEEEYLKRIGLE